MEEVASNPNWRFILTTREYILNSAKLRYEAFSQPPIDFTLCVINLADYVRSIRARILYNHIYFSDLPALYKTAILQDRGYEIILRHRNYNPRVIEYMTQKRHATAVAPSLYLSEFTESLEHPSRIWDHAFKHQISEASRHLLLVLGTLPDEILVSDLEVAFWAFYLARQKKFGFTTCSGDWDNAVKQLDGSLIATRRVGNDLVVSFHSPSIRDYVEDFLVNSESDVADLIGAAHYYEQYTTLWTGRREHRYSAVDRHTDTFLRGLQEHLYGPSARIIRVVGRKGEEVGFDHWIVSNESRAEFVLRIANDLRSTTGDRLLHAVILGLEKLWWQGHANRESLVRLLEGLIVRGLKRDDSAFLAAKNCLMSGLEDGDDFRAAAEFALKYPDVVSSAEVDHLKLKFEQFAAERRDVWDDDPDWLGQVAADLEFVGERLGVDVKRFTEPLYQRASEIEDERAETQPQDEDVDRWKTRTVDADDIDKMFESLRDELEE